MIVSNTSIDAMRAEAKRLGLHLSEADLREIHAQVTRTKELLDRINLGVTEALEPPYAFMAEGHKKDEGASTDWSLKPKS